MRIFLFIVVSLIALAILVVTVVVLRLLARRTQVVKRFGTIDVQLKRRHQLVDELSELSKSKAVRFDEPWENVLFLNGQARSVRSPTEREHFENALSESLGTFLAAAKCTDEYTACPHYCELVTQLRQVENDLRRSMNFYNEVADKFNAAVEGPAARIIAPMFAIAPQPLMRFDFAQIQTEFNKPHVGMGSANQRPAVRPPA